MKEWKTFGEIFSNRGRMGRKWLNDYKDFAIAAVMYDPDITMMHLDIYGDGNEAWTEGTMMQGDLTFHWWEKLEGHWYEVKYLGFGLNHGKRHVPALYLDGLNDQIYI